jgi:DNA ligase-1
MDKAISKFRSSKTEKVESVNPEQIFDDNFEELDEDEKPQENTNWSLPALYTFDAHGNILKWKVGFATNTNQILVTYGHLGSEKIQLFREDVVVNKLHKEVVDKAYNTAKRKYDDKKKLGYALSVEEIDKENILSSGMPMPMLANLMKEDGIDPKTGKFVPGNILQFPCSCQGKFDGVRNLSRLDKSGEIVMVSRKNLERKFFDHIRNDLKQFFKYLPKGTVLDGEFFAPNLTFEEIESIAGRSLKPHPEEHTIKMYIFDLFHPQQQWIHDKRIDIMNTAYDDLVKQNPDKEFPNIIIVGTNVANSYEDIRGYYETFIAENLEGCMVRQLVAGSTDEKVIKRSLYVHRRSNNLLKVKEFNETEVIIEAVKGGKGRDADAALFIYKDPATGIKGVVKPVGTLEQRRHWFKHPEEVIGKLYTIKFFSRTDKSLRFPVGKGFRTTA